MVIHALGNDYSPDAYLRGDEGMADTFEKYLPYIVIYGAVMIAALFMAGTGGRRE